MFSATVLLAIVAVVVAPPPDDETILILTTSNNDVEISSASSSPVTLTLMNFDDNLVYQCDVTPQDMDTSYSCSASVVGPWCPDDIGVPSSVFYVQNPSDDDVHVSALSAYIGGVPIVPDTEFFCVVTGFFIVSDLPDFFGSYVVSDEDSQQLCAGEDAAALTDICVGNESTGCSYSEQSVFFAEDVALWLPPLDVLGVSWDVFVGTACPTTPAPSIELTCQDAGLGLSTPHSCSCQASCDGSTYCNSLKFVQDRLGDAPEDAQCPASTQCCCSCPNCDNYEEPGPL